MKVYLEELVKQYGTNLLIAPLLPGTVMKFELYGRICRIEVNLDGSEFRVEE